VRSGFVGNDLAIAKNKHLPVVVCTWEQDRLIPQPLRRLDLTPPRGRGNAATLDRESVQSFAREAAAYVAAVCDRLGLNPMRIGIDAPSVSGGRKFDTYGGRKSDSRQQCLAAG
jgi:hypothetical protein